MTTEESANLMSDITFRGRIKVCILDYATYIFGEAPTVDGHPGRYRWAQNAGINPDYEAGRLHPMVVMDAQVQLDGAAIDDAKLKISVQTVVNKFI